MAVDHSHGVLYSTGDKKLLYGLDIAKQTMYTQLKISNSQPSKLVIDEENQRIYLATREGLLMILDISSKDHPVLVHTIKMVLHPNSIGASFVKQMHLDTVGNILVCRMSSGIIYLVKLFQPPRDENAFFLEMMEHYKPKPNEKNPENISEMCMIQRLQCYCEGTKMGYLRIRDYNSKGECLLQFQCDFTEKVRMLYHDKLKNLLFAASKDGSLCVWKLPPEWSPKWIEDKLKELRLNRKADGFKNW